MLQPQSERGPSGVTHRLLAGRDRETVLTGSLLFAVTLAAWAWILYRATGSQAASMAGSGMGMSGMGMSTATSDSGGSSVLIDAATYLLAWGIMMAAMMLPSAAPMITLYAAGRRKWSQSGQRAIPTTIFASVYLVIWLAVGIPVYVAGLFVHRLLTAEPGIADLVPLITGLIVIAAGALQFTALKRACLRACQHPMTFILGHWRPGYRGTLRMAWEHGSYCIGCCWGLMLVLVVAGAMSIPWMLLIAAVVAAEKLVPARGWTERVVGFALVLLGLLIVVEPSLAAFLRGGAM